MQDARTGSIGVTPPSKRRSEPDLGIEDESESEDPVHSEYEYTCSNLVTAAVHQLSEIQVVTMSRHEVAQHTNQNLILDPGMTQPISIIDPKAILRSRYPRLLPESYLSSE